MIQREPRFAHLLQDIWRIVFYLLFLSVDIGILVFLPRIQPNWLDGMGRILGVLVGHLILVFAARELVPKPPEGSIRSEVE